jgi:hypothetical protein
MRRRCDLAAERQVRIHACWSLLQQTEIRGESPMPFAPVVRSVMRIFLNCSCNFRGASRFPSLLISTSPTPGQFRIENTGRIA